MANSNVLVAEALKKWLRLLLSHDDHLKLCTFAYESRYEHPIQLQGRPLQDETFLGPEIERNPFGLVRHFLGRLAHHVRASKELVAAATHVSQILEGCRVFAVDHLASVPPPAPDRHTNLDGILNRMLRKGHDERVEIENGLWKFNAVNQLFEMFPGEYRSLKPRVHAEVQILEHFYRNQMQFAENDRFVACSKAACLCCEMYFRYHPARMVVPESHRNVWTNWGPPLVENFSKFQGAGRQQLDILNSMVQEVRDLVISQALGQSSVGHRRPDSKTDITEFRPFSNTPSPIKTLENSLIITGEDALVEKQIQSPRGLSRELLMTPEPMSGENEESDIEDGGVSVYA